MTITNDKFQTLASLGEKPARERKWRDYLAYGFVDADVPQLLAIVQVMLDEEDEDDVGFWSGIHAWRTLGQLGCAEAAVPLIDLFDTLVEVDWALEGLPEVLGMLGEVSLQPLADALCNDELKEFARVMAAHGLCEVAQRFPEAREQVLKHYRVYMAKPSHEHPLLNGLLITYLLDMQARELIEEIRGLFAEQIVDLSCVGDIEDVEIELRLRSKRERRRPSFSPFAPFASSGGGLDNTRSPSPFDEEPTTDIERYLQRYGNEDSISDAPELHGFFTALACSPERVKPSMWGPKIWGGEAHAPKWGDIKEAEHFTDMLMTFYNKVLDDMSIGMCEPLFAVVTLEERTSMVVGGWCHGFVRGLTLWGELAGKDKSVLLDAIEPMQLFTRSKGNGECIQEREPEPDEIETCRLEIEPAIEVLYQHFHGKKRRTGLTPVHEAAKVGRNDPCPCGSGKKFKKCCLH